MKTKVTKKEMRARFDQIIGTGYHNMQFLLRYTEPFAYSTRAEGWACDYYAVDGVLISTGYAPLSARNTKKTYEIEQKYEQQAREISENYAMSYEEKQAQVYALLSKYVAEVSK